MYFYVGQIILDLKRGKLVQVDQVSQNNRVIEACHEITTTQVGGMFNGAAAVTIIRELLPEHMTKWEWGAMEETDA